MEGVLWYHENKALERAGHSRVREYRRAYRNKGGIGGTDISPF